MNMIAACGAQLADLHLVELTIIESPDMANRLLQQEGRSGVFGHRLEILARLLLRLTR